MKISTLLVAALLAFTALAEAAENEVRNERANRGPQGPPVTFMPLDRYDSYAEDREMRSVKKSMQPSKECKEACDLTACFFACGSFAPKGSLKEYRKCKIRNTPPKCKTEEEPAWVVMG